MWQVASGGECSWLMSRDRSFPKKLADAGESCSSKPGSSPLILKSKLSALGKMRVKSVVCNSSQLPSPTHVTLSFTKVLQARLAPLMCERSSSDRRPRMSRTSSGSRMPSARRPCKKSLLPRVRIVTTGASRWTAGRGD
jgi:hypothetical protein